MGCLCSKEKHTVEHRTDSEDIGLHAPFLAIPFDRTNPIYAAYPQVKGDLHKIFTRQHLSVK